MKKDYESKIKENERKKIEKRNKNRSVNKINRKKISLKTNVKTEPVFANIKKINEFKVYFLQNCPLVSNKVIYFKWCQYASSEGVDCCQS